MNLFQDKMKLLFVLLPVLSAFAQEPFTIDGRIMADDFRIVATIADIEISAEEFLLNYEYGPAFLKRKKDSKQRYLDLMINEKVLALEGYAQNLDKTIHVKNTLLQIKSDLMTDELFKEEVMDSVSITESAIRNAVEQDLKHIQIKWLFQKTLKNIENDYYQLTKGVSFDSMFTTQINDTVLIDDRSMETTLFKLKKNNPVLMSIIDTLVVGSFTHPIKTEDGFYIVKIEKGWSDILLTETKWNNHNARIRKALFKQKMDSLSDHYVEIMLRENNPVIKRPVFNLLRAWLAQTVLFKTQFSKWGFIEQKEMETTKYLDNKIQEHSFAALVHLNNGYISLKEFLSWYIPRKAYINLNRLSKDDFSVSVQNIVFRMVRDKLLTDRAQQRGIDNHKEVLKQIQWWENKTVYAKYKLELAKSVKISEDEVLDYYHNNKELFRSKSGVYQSFDNVKTEIKNTLRRERYSTKLIQNVLAAKRKYKIEINKKVLEDLYVDTQNDPRAIEVYTVKKGGLFPHQPYPTIDSEWKYWF
jgi:hypothetical protein